jgi:hypothetical protein
MRALSMRWLFRPWQGVCASRAQHTAAASLLSPDAVHFQCGQLPTLNSLVRAHVCHPASSLLTHGDARNNSMLQQVHVCACMQETLNLHHNDAALAAFDRLHCDSFGQVADLLDAKLQKGLDKQLADLENRNEVQSTRLCEQLESQVRCSVR